MTTTHDLQALAKDLRDDYRRAAPFPNTCINGLFDEVTLSNVLQEILAMDQKKFSYGKEAMSVKGGCSDIEQFSPLTQEFFHYLLGPSFLTFLETLTGIAGLIPDSRLVGGGIHIVRPGGLLGLHADFNKHPRYNLDRRLNVLIYMNKGWKDDWGGHFELWKDPGKDKGPTVKILPAFNTMAVFNTDSRSFHGHPDPLSCPPDRYRIGLNLYYYTNGRPKEEQRHEHSTLFQVRKGNARDRRDMAKRAVKQWMPPIFFKLYNRFK